MRTLRKLYLDDIRTPQTEGWEIVRSYDEFVRWIETNGLPDVVSFDHDLSTEHYGLIGQMNSDILDWREYYDKGDREYTGYDCAKWMCEYCWNSGLPIPNWNVHSANTVGKENIQFLIRGYEKRLN
jgi:hypothetical protein